MDLSGGCSGDRNGVGGGKGRLSGGGGGCSGAEGNNPDKTKKKRIKIDEKEMGIFWNIVRETDGGQRR